MARVKGGYTTRQRRKKVLKLAKGYYGAKHILYKLSLIHIFWKAMVSTEGAVVLRKMCEAFHEVHQLLLVEGVENEEQAAFVRDCACRYIQGYYYAAPLPQEQVYKLSLIHISYPLKSPVCSHQR